MLRLIVQSADYHVELRCNEETFRNVLLSEAPKALGAATNFRSQETFRNPHGTRFVHKVFRIASASDLEIIRF